MPVSELSAVERIARVLAGRHWSSNAEGDDAHAAHEVMSHWFDYRDDAIAILRTLREPDIVMADAGDAEIWKAMVEAAIADYAGDMELDPGRATDSPRGDAPETDMLQPPKLGDLTD